MYKNAPTLPRSVKTVYAYQSKVSRVSLQEGRVENMHIRVEFFVTITLMFSPVTSDEGWFWHVTDFHWDFSYWTEQFSCNGVQIDNPGAFGNQWCDSPWRLIEETVSGIRNIKSDVDFVLWTGDSVAHIGSSHLSTDLNLELVRNITSLMKSQFLGIPIYATFGNHDYYKTNLFPPHGNEIYNATYLIWKEWINDTTQDSNFLKGGYYSILASKSIRIIGLNTNMYYYKDTLTQDLPDPANQFEWLENELKSAAARGERVILTGHVPPGYTTPRAISWMTPAFNERLIDILLEHSDVITGVHFGHEHHDTFRVLYNDSGFPVVSVFIAPSVTPWRYQLENEVEPAHNPGARLVKYDRQTGKQLDMLQYYVDLPSANAKGNISWKLGYNATALYGIPDASPASLHSVIEKMAVPNSDAFKDYIRWYNTNATGNFSCDTQCHQIVMCGVRYLRDERFLKCKQSATNSSSFHCINVWMIFVYVMLNCIAFFIFMA